MAEDFVNLCAGAGAYSLESLQVPPGEVCRRADSKSERRREEAGSWWAGVAFQNTERLPPHGRAPFETSVNCGACRDQLVCQRKVICIQACLGDALPSPWEAPSTHVTQDSTR